MYVLFWILFGILALDILFYSIKRIMWEEEKERMSFIEAWKEDRESKVFLILTTIFFVLFGFLSFIFIVYQLKKNEIKIKLYWVLPPEAKDTSPKIFK